MDTLEVFALNIQPTQIAARIGCDLGDKKAIDYERNNFLRYIRKLTDEGLIFYSQLDAWNAYDTREVSVVYEPEDEFLLEFEVSTYEERALDELEREAWLHQDEPDWLSRAKNRLIDQALSNSGNYNEYGGQL